MEMSSLYTRRLSGSSSRNSFNEEALEQLEFNINDISRASSPASVTSISARSEGRPRRHHSSHSARHHDEDYTYRKKYSKIRGELELERIKARQLQQERDDEMRRLREGFENDKKLEFMAMQKKLEDDKKKEILKMKEDLIKQKDFELQQVLMYKESQKKQTGGGKPDGQKNKDKEESGKKGEVKEKQSEEEEAVKKDADNDIAVVEDKPLLKSSSHKKRSSLTIDKRTESHDSNHSNHNDVDMGQERDGGETYDGGDTEKNHNKKDNKSKAVSENTILASSQPKVDKEKSEKTDKRSRRRSLTRCSEKEKVDVQIVNSTLESLILIDNEAASDNNTTVNKPTNKALSKSIAEHSTGVLKDYKLSHEKHGQDKIADDDHASDKVKGQEEQEKMRQQEVLESEERHRTSDEKQKENEERQRRVQQEKEFEEKICRLEQEKAGLLKQKEETQRTLNNKVKEHKIREDEFFKLKEGYEREIRTVISEHKKVAIGNIEKLKLAETALIEATMSDQEIASISQRAERAERHRRLSTVSLSTLEVETKKEDREKEKVLHKKLADLTGQIQRLERKTALLRTENDTLRQRNEDTRPLEDKIKSLKKRNAELASIARRLEEKAKMLQQENAKQRARSGGATSQEESVDAEHMKRVFSRQRAKDLADHAKVMLAKDREIEELRRKCQELADALSNGEVLMPQNALQYEEKEELENIIKQAAKERLQLEQQLAHSKTREKSPSTQEPSVHQEEEATHTKYRVELEEANKILHGEIEKLEGALTRTNTLESDLQSKASQITALGAELTTAKHENQELSTQLEEADLRNRDLDGTVKELQGRLGGVEQTQEECESLKTTLALATKERSSAQEEVTQLSKRVNSLESLVRDLQTTAEQASTVDHAYQTSLAQLQAKQAEIEQLQQLKSTDTAAQTRAVTSLSSQLEEVEARRREEEEAREDLAREVEKLQAEAKDRQEALEEAEREKAELIERRTKDLAGLSEKNNNLIITNIDTKAPSNLSMDRANTLNPNDRPSTGESFLSAWAAKGPIQVYIAKYNYEPHEFSPNENPEAELPLTAGDYVLVVGEMDEDGFFDGELIDGRQGLVPSNFIQKVEEDDLAEFHAALLQAGHGDLSNSSGNLNSSISLNAAAASSTSTSHPSPSHPSHSPSSSSHPSSMSSSSPLINNNHLSSKHTDINSHNNQIDPLESTSDLDDIAEIDEDRVSVNSRIMVNGASNNNFLPCPKALSLDRQLSSSLVISWRGPEPEPGLEVQAYHVMVDGRLMTSVKVTERTKALLEGVEASHVHRICVRCLSNLGQSKDAQCTMLIGKDVYPTPTDLVIGHITATSAALSWVPGNSNYQHSIMIHGKEVRMVKPGVYRHTLTGLSPGLHNKVTLIAKSISGQLNEEKSRKWVDNVTASISFTTLKAGMPESPLNIMAEPGPHAATLLLTWLPVTITSSGLSNGVQVTGYQVMGDGRRVKVVQGATADHVVLCTEDFRGITPSQLSVRTTSISGGESADSEDVALTSDLLKEMRVQGQGDKVGETRKRSSSHDEPKGHKGHDTDEEIEEAFKELHHTSPSGINAQISRGLSDSSNSELSDIPEVEEDLIGSRDSHLNEVGTTNGMAHSSQNTKVSPKPSPRHTNNLQHNLHSGPKEFHNQKPESDSTRVVPAIEITPDVSIEKSTSLDEDSEREHVSSSTSPNTSKSSAAAMNRSPEASISSHYRGNTHNNPSAFRQVDQSKPSILSSGDDSSVVSNHRAPRPSSHSPASQDQNISIHSPDHRKRSPSLLASEEGGDNDSISGEINVVVDENSVRLFIALFDYDPATMSPNLDSIDEELPFREGQILKVFGDKDADGFYRGESQGRIGYVPCNMVSEVQIDDPELVEQLLKETSTLPDSSQSESAPHSTMSVSDDQPTPTNEMASLAVNAGGRGPVRKMVAMYDYDPQELSPNVDAELELSFKTGDSVMIYGEMDEDGFYAGEVGVQQGLVPSNFLQPAPPSDDEPTTPRAVISPRRQDNHRSSRRVKHADPTNNHEKVTETKVTSPISKKGSPEKKAISFASGSDDIPSDNEYVTSPVSSFDSDKPTPNPKKKGFFSLFKKFGK